MIDTISKILFTQETMIDGLKWFFIIGSCFGVIVGLFIHFKPDSIRVLNKKLNHWYSSRKTLKPFEIMRETDSYVYKHNKLWGCAMLTGSGFFLYPFFTWRLPEGALTLLFPNHVVSILVDAIMMTIWLFLAVFILAGLPVWILLIVNPDLLKRISKTFNHWYSTRLFLLPLVKMHFEIDNWVLKYNQLFGVLFVLGSVFILFTFLFRI